MADRPQFMWIAGEPSGDLLAADLVRSLRAVLPGLACFGAGGPRMAEAGVELAFDMTRLAVVGLVEVLKKYAQFKQRYDQLVELAFHRRPEAIVCVDFSGFNRRFARQIRWEIQARGVTGWKPRIIQYVSPQVWASRPGRARAMARDFDLILAIFPFEKAWYAAKVPQLPVEFVGHPMVDRLAPALARLSDATPVTGSSAAASPLLVLLPGSRVGELRRHLPVMLETWTRIRQEAPATRGLMVLPNEELMALARSYPGTDQLQLQAGNLIGALTLATVAMASTGTVTLECAYLGVPTVALYKTSWSTYQIGKRIIQVKFLAMPNLLAHEAIFPEFIQEEATAGNLSRAVLGLLHDPETRRQLCAKLATVRDSLGAPGASDRAAAAIVQLLR